eukprot:TRINITY_DN15526_c0_g1_i13.p1 TRINITY_DN15526_c0_g1~~TRINITY_DN15526_c0_g1_i13.p1  ORF type:complete len:203 (+),score=66.63 TRINITY_DN15526_c0_g1_i13:101-709(+)
MKVGDIARISVNILKMQPRRAPSIYDYNLRDTKPVSLSLFSYLFAELIFYLNCRDESKSLQQKLNEVGFPIGQRVLELCAFKRKQPRFIKIESILLFIQNEIWKLLFGDKADEVDKSLEDMDEYRIYDSRAIINRYLATKGEQMNCGDFIAGIIQGILYAADFPAKVDTSIIEEEIKGETVRKVVYIIKFEHQVIKRDESIK